MPRYKQVTTWRDARGQTCRQECWVFGATPSNAGSQVKVIIDQMGLLTVAKLARATGTYQTSPSTVQYGTTNTRTPSVMDKAVFWFTTSAGLPIRIEVPAPQDFVWMQDWETVNASESRVATFITDVLTQGIVNREGHGPTAYRGGWRIRRRNVQQNGIYQRTATFARPDE